MHTKDIGEDDLVIIRSATCNVEESAFKVRIRNKMFNDYLFGGNI